MNHRRSFDFFNERLSTEDTLAAGLPQGHVPLGLVAGKLDRSRRRVTQTRWQPWASEREGTSPATGGPQLSSNTAPGVAIQSGTAAA